MYRMVYIIHHHWEEEVILEPSGQLYRQFHKEETGEYIQSDTILIVQWRLWGTEIFMENPESPGTYRPFEMLQMTENCVVETRDWNESCFRTSTLLLRRNGDYARITETYTQQILTCVTLQWEKWPVQYLFPIESHHYIETEILPLETVVLTSYSHPPTLFFVDIHEQKMSQTYHGNKWEWIQWNDTSLQWNGVSYIKCSGKEYQDEKVYYIQRKGQSIHLGENLYYLYEDHLYDAEFHEVEYIQTEKEIQLIQRYCKTGSHTYERTVDCLTLKIYSTLEDIEIIYIHPREKKSFIYHQDQMYIQYDDSTLSYFSSLFCFAAYIIHAYDIILLSFSSLPNETVRYAQFHHRTVFVWRESAYSSWDEILSCLNQLYSIGRWNHERVLWIDASEDLSEIYNIKFPYFYHESKGIEYRIIEDSPYFSEPLENHSSTIPYCFHFIWIGKGSFPVENYENIYSWIKYHPQATFYFWNDDNLPPLYNQELYDASDVYAMKADILRYEILYRYGGVYVDVDFECYRPIDSLLYSPEVCEKGGFSAYECSTYIAIGIMGAIPGHPFLKEILQTLSYSCTHLSKSVRQRPTVPELTGPVFFTEMAHGSTTPFYFFSPEYFYSYTFQDRQNKKHSLYNDQHGQLSNIYAVHLWNHSWGMKKNTQPDLFPFPVPLLMQGRLKNEFLIYSSASYTQLRRIRSYVSPSARHKKKVLHIMGHFFSGGIERFLSLYQQYYDREKYELYLCCMYHDQSWYPISEMKIYSFQEHKDLHAYIRLLQPDFILDHYSLYLDTNEEVYQKLRIPVLHVIHTAVCYAKDVSRLHMEMCVHLYDEKEKHESWNSIPEQELIPLGIPMGNHVQKKKRDPSHCRISIVGRISPEKIPLSFLQKLCAMKTSHSITIYGEKHKEYHASYIEEFETCISQSHVHYQGFQPIDSIMAQTDFLVIPSLYETGSYTCIEAFRNHIPVIARKGPGGISSLVIPHQNGYLCASDEEIIDCIQNAHQREIKEYTFDVQQHDICHMMIQYETIIENKIKKHSTLFIITSVIHPSHEPLSYYPIRSVFSAEERWKQTLDTVTSIRKYYPEAMIVLCEGSTYENEGEKEMEKQVDVYIKCNKREISTHPYKGYTECLLLLKAWETLEEYGYTFLSFDSVFKISGRYALSSTFDSKQFENHYNCFSLWDHSQESYTTVFYKIHDIADWIYALHDSLHYTLQNVSLEMALYETFQRNICIVDKLHVEGHLSTEGYLISL